MKYAVTIVVLVLALIAAGSVYVVPEGHAAVLTRSGGIVQTDVPPGLHLKVPFISDVKVYDTRTIVTQSEPEDYKTADGDPVRAGFFVRWRVADADAWYKATRGDESQVVQQLAPLVRTALREAIAGHSVAELLADDGGGIDTGLRNAVATHARGTLGVDVLEVGVEKVLPPDDTLPSIYKRMGAGAEANAARIREDGAAAAAAIRAEGAVGDRQVLADASKQAAVVRGEGDAAAAKVYAQASAKNPDFFRYWSSLETWRRTFGDGGAVVVLDSDSPFMQAIDEGATAGKH